MKKILLILSIFCVPFISIAQSRSVSISPNAGVRSQSLPVIITGINTHFKAGSSTVQFYRSGSPTTELNFSNKLVINDTLVGGLITVNVNATLGSYNLKVMNTIEGIYTSTNSFIVSSSGTTPVISSIKPDQGGQGDNLMVVISGLNTHFNQSSGTNQINFIKQGTATTRIVAFENSGTNTIMSAEVHIASNAATGLYDLEVVNSLDGSMILPKAFTVTAGTGPKLVSVNPGIGHLKETLDVLITGSNTSFTQASQTLFFFQQASSSLEIQVNSLYINNDTSMLANISISKFANRGFYSCVVARDDDTTGSQILFLAESFEVDFALGLPKQKISETGLSVFPNPAQNQFTIRSVAEPIEQIELYDLQGRILLSHIPLKPEVEIEVKIDDYILPKQCYFLKIKTASGIVVRKLILE